MASGSPTPVDVPRRCEPPGRLDSDFDPVVLPSTHEIAGQRGTGWRACRVSLPHEKTRAHVLVSGLADSHYNGLHGRELCVPRRAVSGRGSYQRDCPVRTLVNSCGEVCARRSFMRNSIAPCRDRGAGYVNFEPAGRHCRFGNGETGCGNQWRFLSTGQGLCRRRQRFTNRRGRGVKRTRRQSVFLD